MAFEVVIGRNRPEMEKYGTRGAIFLGKQYVKMGEVTSLSNHVFLDVASSHVVFLVGKRGFGKSYSAGVIAEGMADLEPEIKNNLSVILLDTMGVYWTMKYPNLREADLLKSWNLEPKPLDVKIYTPTGFYKKYREEGIPTDFPFAIRPEDLTAEDWCMTFEIEINSSAGVLLSRVVHQALDKIGNFSLAELIEIVRHDDETDAVTKHIVVNQFHKVEDWGIFAKEGTALKDLVRAGQTTVLDLSPYATLPSGWLIKALVVGLISKRLFAERMLARKTEEFSTIDASMHYFTKEEKEKLEEPLVWLILDEAHQLLPRDAITTATDSLVTILREGRQPGISLVLISQQPGKIHTDVLTQADIVLSHRITAKIDVDALGQLAQTYMRKGLDEELANLPPVTGSAIIFDDKNERIFPIQVRPRFTWHGGSSPTAIKEKKEMIKRTFLV